jgi:hypothetical protein
LSKFSRIRIPGERVPPKLLIDVAVSHSDNEEWRDWLGSEYLGRHPNWLALNTCWGRSPKLEIEYQEWRTRGYSIDTVFIIVISEELLSSLSFVLGISGNGPTGEWS